MATNDHVTSPASRLADLYRQGFMKPRRTRKAPAPSRPIIACPACLNWHAQGRHTADASTRKANLKETSR